MKKLLVVDDEMDVCDFVKHFFEERDFKVYSALNGSDGIKIVFREKPDIILLDVKMKGLDGIETLKRIKEKDKNAKVIMVTAMDDQGNIDAATRLGAARYVTKPLVLEELESAVMELTREAAKEGKNA